MTDQDDSSEFIPKEKPQMPAKAGEVLPDTLQVVPLEGRPYFPVLIQPLVIAKDPWAKGIRTVAESTDKLIGLTLSSSSNDKLPSPSSFSDYGVVAKILRYNETQDKIQFIAQGVGRFRIAEWLRKSVPFVVRAEYPKEHADINDPQLRAYAMSLINGIKELMAKNPLYNEELKQYLNRFSPNDPSPLTDFAAAITSAEANDLQEVLETLPLLERMEKALLLVNKELELVRIQTKIAEETQEQLSDQQREFFLRQQLKVIQKELGIAKDDRESDAETFAKRLGDRDVPAEVESRVEEELNKLTILEPSSAEYGVTRNYLDWITSVPWGMTSKDSFDLAKAKKALDADHHGLEDIKERIIEFLAVGAYRGFVGGSIVLLVGPPGVGKTSIGKSISQALGRKFYRFSVGGMRDEAEIKGHRKTYVGAMPGKFVQALKEVRVSNPVIMLDEVDKIGASYQGDPASALLEALDPEQNSEFLDHYLDLRLDLSQVLFICTANQLDTIPGPLIDRMETIHLAGYLSTEKLEIARHHLWPKQLIKAGLNKSNLKISDAALRKIIDGYARESGVRGLDKQLGRIVRKSLVGMIENEKKRATVNLTSVESLLGSPVFRKQKPRKGIGVVNGLAWTALGGTTLAVESSVAYAGSRGFKQTGQLGDVMQESAQIAYSFIGSNLKRFQASESFMDEATIHIHVPEGATPKDGPSAGITMATALLSLAKGRAPVKNLAMTGELTLTGKVLPVGGIREKVIAARRAGFKEAILPLDNERDFDELPDYLKEEIKIYFVGDYEEVAEVVFNVG
ncbi:MAG: endopeptidase La [Gammaproteobacteria bacterium]|nr:endopeptidase La [Gammaproteobacteria bacterium]